MIWHSSDISAVLKELSVDENNGLANGVAYERLEKFGKNQIADFKTASFFKRFLSQLNRKSVYALVAISVICTVISAVYNQGFFYSSLLIIAIILLNAAVTAYNQTICDKAIYQKRVSAIPNCTVIREGIERQIPSNELVIGDIILLNEGDYICADVRLLETNLFRCNELALTGDIIPVEKDAQTVFEDLTPVSGRKNMAFSGCNVIHGTAKAVVVETGSNTEIAKLTTEDTQTSSMISGIEERLNSLSHIINVFVLVACAIVFFIGVLIGLFSSVPFASVTANSLLNAIALGVCAIPETLPYIAVIVTALGTGRLIREGIIIKNTKALETLAKTTVLCADKTGVFTCNNMSVKCVYNGEVLENAESETIEPKSSMVLRLATACSQLENDVTEAAIEAACFKFNKMDKSDVDNSFPRLSVIPFDGDRKMMTSINMIEGKPFAIVKGAPETVINKCVGIDTEAINNICVELASKSFRLICIAIKSLEEIPANPNPDEIECDLKFAGIICLEDPARDDAYESIEFCKKAGIKVIMITGDNFSTATSIAKSTGLILDDFEAINGDELENLSDEEFKTAVCEHKVFSRISPAQKLKIVQAFKDSGEVVTVTGNSLDDADVLSVSDVGFAIGSNGNDVARGNADTIIKNNDFPSIVNVFKECHILINNIKNAVNYLIGSNLSELLFFIIGLLIFKMPPLLAVQLLWINLLTDAAPAISVTIQHSDIDNLSFSERLLKGRLFDLNSLVSLAVSSVTLAICSISAFTIGNVSGVSTAYTMAFATIALSQIFHAFNFVSNKSIIDLRYKHNEFLIISTVVSVIITVILCSTPAGFVFGLKALSFKNLIICFVLALIIIPVNEIVKLIQNKKSNIKQVS